MPPLAVTFWVFVVAGATLSAWWLAVRPGTGGSRDAAGTVAVLILVLATLLCLLALTGGPSRVVVGGLIHPPMGG